MNDNDRGSGRPPSGPDPVKNIGSVIIQALPAIVSPILEAAITAFRDGKTHILEGELMQALEQLRLFEAASAVNAELAKTRYETIQKQDALLAAADDTIRSQQQTIDELRGAQ